MHLSDQFYTDLKFYPPKKAIKYLPSSNGVYLFCDNHKNPLYVGKAVNLKNRVSSYFGPLTNIKTADMVNKAYYLSFIEVASEIEALLLEAALIKIYQPKYNLIQKDDKSPLYIKITKDYYPRVLSARKDDIADAKYIFGPFPSGYKVKYLLKIIRKLAPFSRHRLGKKVCLDSQLGLCHPCPNFIESKTNKILKTSLRRQYLKSVRTVNRFLSGDIQNIKKDLFKQMIYYSKLENYEEAQKAKTKIELINYITQPITDINAFLENPNFIYDIRKEETSSLIEFLSPDINIKKLKKIECFDVAHFSGLYTTASMVVFVNGEARKDLYRHFRLKKLHHANDTSAMTEIACRRKLHLNDWGGCDLIIVDGGKGQVKSFYEIFKDTGIPIVGLSKPYDTLIIPVKKIDKLLFIRKNLPNSPGKNLLTRIRDEAHRFARRYHHHLFKKSLLSL